MRKPEALCVMGGALIAYMNDGTWWALKDAVWVEQEWPKVPQPERKKSVTMLCVDEVDPSVPTFGQFWDAYKHKKGRTLAEKVWHKMSDADKKLAMNAVASYVASTFTDGQYPTRAHASTWLNQRRWEDEESAPAIDTTPEEDVF